ncbi:glycosyltransferase family 2 protein [Kaistia terrae]|uniref:Glycosyltransferase family 2 protein n=1 Tax=Kaistia terrae TaxID=537017 RepID=A0ABW0Q9D1_9HYPH|nr:glycosyltransferase family 2 protein [Kaistia terrae]MCX5581130.1 glycosyltransferase [Kaistia terrae]
MFLYVLDDMGLADRLIYCGLLLGLIYCCLSYQLSRYGAARRAQQHRAFTETDVAYLFEDRAPSVAVLIPTYREERRVIIMTMLSAALARYSNRRIVLLVDDPPSDPDSVELTLSAVDEVWGMLDKPMRALRAEAAAWQRRSETDVINFAAEAGRLKRCYDHAAYWLEGLARTLEAEISPAFGHVDRFFIDRILLDLARHYRSAADRVAAGGLTIPEIAREYRVLANLFCTDISSFERKTFENLSHAPNKAMNLNAYIGLMGGSYVARSTQHGAVIETTRPNSTDSIAIAGADYVLTLDADSVILNDYMLQLVHLLNGNPTLGVAQTPYLTFPKGTAPVERIAGATTDIQYLIHQGATYFNASYWVGANALIRFEALQQIVREQVEGGKSCRVFIQDETVIEDTGSTIDLLHAGWSVHNHFAPMAYSATPADFGALAIQRKRWSNGGLIIFPMLLKQYLGNSGRFRRLPELMLRTNYLLSPVIGNVAVFILMVWAGSDGRALVWTPLVMVPYFLLYGMDLKRLGYRFRDLFAVCALNLMLLPVSFAGIAASIRQIVTGKKGSFSRTPKVADRTFIPPYCFLFNGFMLLLMSRYVIEGILAGQYLGAIIPALNVSLYAYGLHHFIGFRHGFADLMLATRQRLETLTRPAIGALAKAQAHMTGNIRMLRFRPTQMLAASGLFVFVMVAPMNAAPKLSNDDFVGGAIASQTSGKTAKDAEPASQILKPSSHPSAHARAAGTDANQTGLTDARLETRDDE